MLKRNQKHILLKFFSMFSVIRGYNILIVIIAQYLASIYIFAPQLSVKQVLLDVNLLMLVLASSACIAAGYIINNFYDSEKDLINRPNKSMLDKLVSQNTKLSFYFVLNFLAIILASYVSFKAVVFFSAYIFGIWFYSHKLKKITFVGNITSALLTITPFFIVLLHYSSFNTIIFLHATFLLLIMLVRELIKDLENLKGDLAQGYKTVPVAYGLDKTKILISVLIGLMLIPIYFLLNSEAVGLMSWYFYLCIGLLFGFVILLWKFDSKQQYNWLHNILKVILVTGVFCIVLIDINVVLNKLL
jgi:4-hydroxybenzoate polyprenyltransferase